MNEELRQKIQKKAQQFAYDDAPKDLRDELKLVLFGTYFLGAEDMHAEITPLLEWSDARKAQPKKDGWYLCKSAENAAPNTAYFRADTKVWSPESVEMWRQIKSVKL